MLLNHMILDMTVVDNGLPDVLLNLERGVDIVSRAQNEGLTDRVL